MKTRFSNAKRNPLEVMNVHRPASLAPGQLLMGWGGSVRPGLVQSIRVTIFHNLHFPSADKLLQKH